jgi:hypothetical protein
LERKSAGDGSIDRHGPIIKLKRLGKKTAQTLLSDAKKPRRKRKVHFNPKDVRAGTSKLRESKKPQRIANVAPMGRSEIRE